MKPIDYLVQWTVFWK